MEGMAGSVDRWVLASEPHCKYLKVGDLSILYTLDPHDSRTVQISSYYIAARFI